MQEQLELWFGPSGATAARYIIAFVVVLLLLFALRWVIRRYMGGPSVRGGRSRQPRLAVMDVAVVDARRRLVLVRRDNIEHLVMIGGPTDIVIEQTIVRGVPVGTMGRMPMRPSQAGDAVATTPDGEPPAKPLGAAAPGPGRATVPPPPASGVGAAASTTAAAATAATTAAAASGFRHAPEPVVARASDEPTRAQPPVRPVRAVDVPRANRVPERAPDRATDRTMTRPVDRPVDRTVDRPVDRPMDRTGERPVLADRRTEQTGGQPVGRSAAEPPRRFDPAVAGRTSQDAPRVTPLSRAAPSVTHEPPRPVIVEDDIAAAVPAAPLVAPQEPSVRPIAANVPNVTPPRPETSQGFDDLARRLDEALQLDLDDETPSPAAEAQRGSAGPDRGQDGGRTRPDIRQEPVLSSRTETKPDVKPEPSPIPYVRPTRGPAARAESEHAEIAADEAPEPASAELSAGEVSAPGREDRPAQGTPAASDRPASVLGAASAWFRSRPAPATPPVAPSVETEADPTRSAPEAPPSAAEAPASGSAERSVGTRFSDPESGRRSGAPEPTPPSDAPAAEPPHGEGDVATVSGGLEGERSRAADRPAEKAADRPAGRSGTAPNVSARLADDLARILEDEPLEPAEPVAPAAGGDHPVLSESPVASAGSASAGGAPAQKPEDVAPTEAAAASSDQELEMGPDGRPKPETGSDAAVSIAEAIPPRDAWDVEPTAQQDESVAALAPVPETPIPSTEDEVAADQPSEQPVEDVAGEDAETTAPEPAVDQSPQDEKGQAPPVASTQPKKAGSDFTSLEDEMARLLDELAGDGSSRN